jgi:UDP-N-acetylmuramyl tripeptide synthase
LRSERGTRRADGSRTGAALLDALPETLSTLAARLSHEVVLVSGTNGKTTIAALVTTALVQQGHGVVTNSIGANQPSGIAAALVEATRPGGEIQGDYGVFEVDERWLPELVRATAPKVLVLSNLFRDQLDRHGEIELVADLWERMLNGAPEDMVVVACADDLRLTSLTADREHVALFGIDDNAVGHTDVPHAADVAQCPRCGVRVDLEISYVGHLGRFRCPSCGAAPPPADVVARAIDLRGSSSASFTLASRCEERRVKMALPGVFNVYNAAAAAATLTALGMSLDEIADGLERATPVFGRSEVVRVGEVELLLLLAKNPTGMNEVVKLVSSTEGPLNLMFCLNDRVYDGRDVSWIWDVDLECLASRVGCVVCTGSRAAEMALRLKYAGVPQDAIVLEDRVDAAIDAAAHRGSGYVIANYTAMLDVRDVLASEGHVRSVWR